MRHELAKNDFELINRPQWDEYGNLKVEVKKLQPVSIKEHSLFIPIVTNLLISFDTNNKINNIEEAPATQDKIKDAEMLVKTLVENHQIAGLDVTGQSEQMITHEIEVNEKGQQVVKRRRYNFY